MGSCPGCGTELAPRLLACPACRRLVHAERLEELAAAARAAEAAGDVPAELRAWREALDLLPPGSAQHARLAERVARLADQPAAARARGPRPPWWSVAGLVAAAMFLLTKGKFLLLGLTKAGTFFSMLAFLGVYWAAFGWQLALGLVLSIYVHEMGHAAELVRRGYPATAPMFIPGIGAFVRLKQRPVSAIEDARIGLAGPWWGLAAAVAAHLAWRVTDVAVLAGVARLGAWINLFNLLPLWQLDGSRGFAPLSRIQRLACAAALLGSWLVTRDGLVLIIGLVALGRAIVQPGDDRGDVMGLLHYLALVAGLTALMMLPVPISPA